MSKRNGQVLVGAMVPAQQATAFRDLAQAANLGVSAALRQMIAERIEAAKGQGEDLLPTDVAVGHSKRITIRLRDSELAILTQAAKNAGTPIANLIRSIVLNHLAGQKQWNDTQSDQLLAIEREMRKIVFHLSGLTSALSDWPEDDRRVPKQRPRQPLLSTPKSIAFLESWNNSRRVGRAQITAQSRPPVTKLKSGSKNLSGWLSIKRHPER